MLCLTVLLLSGFLPIAASANSPPPEPWYSFVVTNLPKGTVYVDLLIRTSGEQRISNYMLWQTAYTEYYFTEVLWPDFRKMEFQQALDAYSKRERRFGKV